MSASSVETQPAVRSVHPPAWLMHAVMNPIVRLAARTPLGRRAGAIAVLHFQGRRTGRHYVVPVVAHDLEGSVHVFTDARWAANFRGGAPIAIRRRGKTQGGTARVVDDPADAARRIRGILTEKKPRALALAIDKDHVPSDADLNAARTVILIDVEA